MFFIYISLIFKLAVELVFIPCYVWLLFHKNNGNEEITKKEGDKNERFKQILLSELIASMSCIRYRVPL